MVQQKDQRSGSGAALLIIDMVNKFDFEGAEAIIPKAQKAAEVITVIKKEVSAANSPVIYVNDNFGEWHSDRDRLIRHAYEGANPLHGMIRPEKDDFFIIKPQFSGFYATNLPVILPKLGVRRLILAGVATDICILFTAADAHMRGYDLWIPANAVAAENDRRSCWALDIMANSMGAAINAATDRTVRDWIASERS
ncbi:cysteine hydrolase family protein [Novosphingobium sp. YAF33]|uniref:cysteine hydrolase family protein n=1 Tax=Novosphingobium sp. YAF33 TaxID=3233082 RepID=UPI003F94446E